MNDVFKNLRGTTRDVFKIGKDGSNIFVRDTSPSTLEGFDGDWCLINSSIPKILKKVVGEWIDLNAKNVIDVSTATYTYSNFTANDVVLCNNSAELTITIDSVPPKGYTFDIKDANGNSSTTNIIINCINGITIDGNSSITLNNDYTSVTLLSTGTVLLLI